MNHPDNPEHLLDAALVPNLTTTNQQFNALYWSFFLGGMVDIPLCLSFADLQAYPVAERECLLTCSGNPPGSDFVPQTRWQGTGLSDLLAEVNIQPQVRYLYAADGYTTCIEWADLSNALLAYQLDDQPLTAEQGFPVRLIVPGLYGYKMPKHVQHIILSDQPLAGYWEKRGWPQRGQIAPTAAFATPRDQAIITGPTTLRGIAFAGNNPIMQVEISVDDSPWMPVTNASTDALVHWSIDWTPPAPGLYRLQARALSSPDDHPRSHSLVVEVRSS
jgi:DMSO/TMAO reductase YedYZ molybdopterin-dependent catalytic subunit